LSTQITDFDDRLAVAEKAPTDGTSSDTALCRHQREFDQLRAEPMPPSRKTSRLWQRRLTHLPRPAQLEQEATATAQAVRAALNRVAVVVETGAVR
jgi:hypothetical protein